MLDNNIKLGSDKAPPARNKSNLAESADLQLPVKGDREAGLMTGIYVSSLALAGHPSYSCDFDLDPCLYCKQFPIFTIVPSFW